MTTGTYRPTLSAWGTRESLDGYFALPYIQKTDTFSYETITVLRKQNLGPNDSPLPTKQSTTTRLPPTGRNNNLVHNGVANGHHSTNTRNSHGKQNGDVSQNNRKPNDKKHVSSITNQKNEAYKLLPRRKSKSGLTSKSNSDLHVNHSSGASSPEKVHHKERVQGESRSNDSRNSSRTRPASNRQRNLSPRTDSTEYRIKNPRNYKRENGPVSPRTEISTNTSESRLRSKEFTFRWNASSRNTSPDDTEKLNSTSPRNYEPSARVRSFYAFLNGRAKKRKTIQESSSRSNNKGILSKSSQRNDSNIDRSKHNHRNDIDKDRPNTFVYLRSKATDRSAWTKEPGELTYKPSTLGPEEISQAYVGEDSVREAEMNEKLIQMQQANNKGKENKNMTKRSSKVPPWYDNGVILNRRQAGVYKNMSNAYGAEAKKRREQRFVQKLAEYEVYKAKQQWEDLLEKEKKKRESKDRQTLQLNELRQRFEDEAYHRFHTQYVTSRVLEHEKMNRNEYGLPELDGEEPENKAVIKRKKVVPKSLITEDMIQDIYKKKFNTIFDVNKGNGMGRRPKTPKMEGIDTVVLEQEDKKDTDTPVVVNNPKVIDIANNHSKENGNIKEKKFMVKDVIDDAKKQVNDNKQKQGGKMSKSSSDAKMESNTSSNMNDIDLDDDSDDEDDDDIFEKARRKYDLDVE